MLPNAMALHGTSKMRCNDPYTLVVFSSLKSSQELRVTLTVKIALLSNGTLSHEPSERVAAL